MWCREVEVEVVEIDVANRDRDVGLVLWKSLYKLLGLAMKLRYPHQLTHHSQANSSLINSSLIQYLFLEKLSQS